MRFKFEASEKGKIHNGHLDAVDREQALWLLESKGMRVHNLQAAPDESAKGLARWSFVAVSLFAIGAVAMFWSVFLHDMVTPGDRSRPPLVLEVSGKLDGKLELVNKIQVLFPQLPARLEGAWKEVGQQDGSFRLRREISTLANPPLYFDLSVTDAEGRVLAQAKRSTYDPSTSQGKAPTLTISALP